MTDTAPHPLTDQTISRLRKLAEGNGLSPEKIELIDTQEKTYIVEGITHLTPFCEVHPVAYAGPVRGKDRTIVPNMGALQQEVQTRQKDFYEKKAWLPAALEELKTAPGEGWGLDGAKISLPSQSVVLAANDTCPGCQGRKIFTCVQCHGQGTVICTYCQGKGLEICYNCAGRGINPSHPDQPCVVCHGKRYIPCRFCKSSGQLICPTCAGTKGTICPQCNGAGIMTQEVSLGCGARINFSLKGDAWPSGLRRGLDRLGTANLIKGHADVTRLPEEPPPPNEDGSPTQNKGTPATIRYQASLPYADIRMRFGGGRVLVINVFGKRGLTMGVPPFLDESLKPAHDQLKQAVEGKIPLDKVLSEARAMRDAFALITAGNGKPENLRKIYPLGLTPKMAQEILLDMRRALDQSTLSVRSGSAVGCGVVVVLALAAFIMTPIHAQVMGMLPIFGGMAIDLAALVLAMTMAWIGLGKAIQFKLNRSFPNLKISLHSNAGSIGPLMLTGIGIAWLATMLLAPTKPDWLLYLLGFIIH